LQPERKKSNNRIPVDLPIPSGIGPLPFGTLPQEIIIQILSFLNTTAVSRFSQISKWFNQPNLWKLLYLLKWPFKLSATTTLDINVVDWKKYFLRGVKVEMDSNTKFKPETKHVRMLKIAEIEGLYRRIKESYYKECLEELDILPVKYLKRLEEMIDSCLVVKSLDGIYNNSESQELVCSIKIPEFSETPVHSKILSIFRSHNNDESWGSYYAAAYSTFKVYLESTKIVDLNSLTPRDIDESLFPDLGIPNLLLVAFLILSFSSRNGNYIGFATNYFTKK